MKILLQLIKENPIKIILLIISIGCLPFIFMLTEPVKDKDEFIEKVEIKGENYYVYYGNKNEYDIMKQPEGSKIVGNYFVRYRTDYLFITLIVISSLSFVILLGSSIVIDNDINWDYKLCKSKALMKLIELEIEDDTYYYYIHGRRIGKADRRLNKYEVKDILKDYIESPNLYPKIKSKAMLRRDKISHLTKETS